MSTRGFSGENTDVLQFAESGWSFTPINPSLNLVAVYNDGTEFEVPVIGYLLLMGEDDQGEDAPYWTAAVLDEATGNIYSPVNDTNFLRFTVRTDPTEVSVIGTVTTG